MPSSAICESLLPFVHTYLRGGGESGQAQLHSRCHIQLSVFKTEWL